MVDWAFSLEAPGNNFSGPMVTDSLAGMSVSRSPINLPPGAPHQPQGRDTARTPVPLPLRAPNQEDGTGPTMTAHGVHAHDDHDAEVAWGGAQEHDSDQPVLLEDVPDVSSKYPAVPSGLGAAAQVAMGADAASRKTLIGQAMPQGRRGSQPNLWAQGSSEDAVPAQRGRYPTGAEFTPSQAQQPIDDTQRSPLVDGGNYTGAVVIQKKGGTAKVAIIAAAVVAVAAAVVVVVMTMNKGNSQEGPPVAAKPQTGKLKFVIEPPDSTIQIPGIPDHVGSPFSIDLDPGKVSVKIVHDGYKSNVETIELSAGETQTFRVGLDKVQAGDVLSKLTIESDPAGLPVTLDGAELPNRTPIDKLPVNAGTHTVVIKQNGQEVWRETFMATGDSDFDFKPVLTEEKKRERAEQAAQRVAVAPTPRQRDTSADRVPAVVSPTHVVREETDVGTHDKTPAKDINVGSAADTGTALPAPPETKLPTPPVPDKTPVGSGSAVATTPPPPEHKDATGAGSATGAGPGSAKVATAPITPTPKSATPAIVSPSAVKRVSGSLPSIDTVPRAGETPPSKISTMLCIDTGGNVTTVKVLTKGLPGTVPSDLQSAMSGWKYQPYKVGGNAQAACFVVSFGVKWPDSSSRGN